jgi:uncharacterized Fe-S cluster-containing radical SAM superfamily protein
MFDAVERCRTIEKFVTRIEKGAQERRYCRTRCAMWYGGIVTADCVGCNLMCRFCWVSDSNMKWPAKQGEFLSPKQVADNLVRLGGAYGVKQFRISGGEPTLGRLHLIGVLEALKNVDCKFILETNGIPLAVDDSFVRELVRYRFVHVRVSFKGCTSQEFSRITGARPENFELQFEALRKLHDYGVSCHPSVMAAFSTKPRLAQFAITLERIDPRLSADLELEELIVYPHVARRLKDFGARDSLKKTLDRQTN